MPGLSPRLREAVDALPLTPASRVLEIGCGPGAAAREVWRRVPAGYVHAIDRSPRAIAQARAGSTEELASGRLALECVAIEDFTSEARFDVAFALRVGGLDGRHPELERAALARIRAVLAPGGRVFIDGGDPLRELTSRVLDDRQ
ncbi:class I SAM-dependent methyltransferase [Herbiconiux sp. SYSU D00978]|uniref:class I SAM-dependent methyltransferase n=1 Tax=Herbiconiux sp. SYSU D00978 TaxID=2812562 RepID=UPI001A971C2E|nr:class I SAM-dependent methyltransferase [Herbiconiux sp. SYSU D00978]